MDQALSSYYLYRSFHIKVDKKDSISLVITHPETKLPISHIELLTISLAGLSFTTTNEIPLDIELNMELHMKKFFNRWDIGLKGKVINFHLINSSENLYHYSVVLEDSLELSYFIKDYIHRFSSKKLKNYLTNSALAEKQTTINDGVELFSLLMTFYKDIFSLGKDKMQQFLEEAMHLLNATHSQLYIINPDTNKLELKNHVGESMELPKFVDFREGELGAAFTNGNTINIGTHEDAVLTSPVHNKNRKIIGVARFHGKLYDGRFTHADEKGLHLLTGLFSQFFLDYCPLSGSSQIDYLNPNKRNIQLYIGNSLTAQKVRKTLHTLKTINENVHIIGEEGTGKSFIAENIHKSSVNALEELYTFSCSDIDEKIDHLLDILKENSSGTILLKDVELLKFDQQTKIYQQMIFSNKRVISTSNTKLDSLVNKHEYHQKFYDLLTEAYIHLPPLRNRGGDIINIAKYFLKNECEERQIPELIFSKDTKEKILSYHWPKNIEELELLIKKSIMKSKPDQLQLDLELPISCNQSIYEELAKYSDKTIPLQEHIRLLKKAI